MRVPFFSSRRSRRRRRPSRRTALLLICGALAVAILWRPLLRATGAAASAAASKNALARVESHAGALRRAAAESGFDPNLLAGVAYAESKGKLSAVSQRDALGLFQLMLPTARERARELGLPEPTRSDLLSDAQLNARLAAKIAIALSRTKRELVRGLERRRVQLDAGALVNPRVGNRAIDADHERHDNARTLPRCKGSSWQSGIARREELGRLHLVVG